MPEPESATDTPQYEKIHEAADQQRKRMVELFLAAVLLAEEEYASTSGLAPAIVTWGAFQNKLREFEGLIQAAFEAGANGAAPYLPPLVAKLRWDALAPEAQSAVKSQLAELVREVTDESKAAIRDTIADLQANQMSAPEAVERIRSVIGLTQRQALAMEAYRTALRSAGMPLGDVLSLTEKYRQELLQYRADMIASTESLRAASLGQQELWRQAAAQAGIPLSHFQQVWVTVPDDRRCLFCEELDGAKIAFGGEFTSTVGNGETAKTYTTFVPPLHPLCRCSLELRYVGEVTTTTKVDMQPQWLRKDAKQRYTLGVVYEPDIEDSQGDFARSPEIEKAAWSFMRALQGKTDVTKIALRLLDSVIKTMKEDAPVRLDVSEVWEELQKAEGPLNDMHMFDGDYGDIVECYVARSDQVINGQVVKAGSWLMGVVWTPDYWTKVEAGERTGFSMEGMGRRIARDAI